MKTDRAKKAMKGIFIGDAFGESFFDEPDGILKHIRERTILPTTWEFTDSSRYVGLTF
jgi:hypothetical protein